MRRLVAVQILSTVLCLVGLPALADARALDRVLTIAMPGGGQQHVLYVAPPQPRATLVMFPGGDGDIGLDADGNPRHADNFAVRSRDLWVAAGFAVLIPDTFNGRNLRGLRSSPAYAALIGALVETAHAQAPGPVFLFGTSQGAIAAMNGAAHLRHGEIAGVVLSEAVSVPGGSHETVFDAHPAQVNVPALVIANSDDRCRVAPPQEAANIAAAMTTAHSATVLPVSGGDQRSSRDCGSLSPHGYYGIETSVVSAVASWIRQQPAK